MPKTILNHTYIFPSGHEENQDLELELFDDGHITMVDKTMISEDGGFWYLYAPQVKQLVEFLVEHGNLFNSIYSYYIDLKIHEAKEKKT